LWAGRPDERLRRLASAVPQTDTAPSLARPPEGARRDVVDLVAEGVAWRSTVGLATLDLAVPALPELAPIPGGGRGGRPGAPELRRKIT
jgi:hypothetical protein